jgi:hypothetical protein
LGTASRWRQAVADLGLSGGYVGVDYIDVELAAEQPALQRFLCRVRWHGQARWTYLYRTVDPDYTYNTTGLVTFPPGPGHFPYGIAVVPDH